MITAARRRWASRPWLDNLVRGRRLSSAVVECVPPSVVRVSTADRRRDLPSIYRDTGRQGGTAGSRGEPKIASELGKQGLTCGYLFGYKRAHNPKVAGTNPAPATNVMSQDIGNPRTPGSGVSLLFEAWLVADVGVEGQVSEEFSGVGCDDADVEVVDEEDDGGAVVGAADADVVHAAGSSQ